MHVVQAEGVRPEPAHRRRVHIAVPRRDRQSNRGIWPWRSRRQRSPPSPASRDRRRSGTASSSPPGRHIPTPPPSAAGSRRRPTASVRRGGNMASTPPARSACCRTRPRRSSSRSPPGARPSGRSRGCARCTSDLARTSLSPRSSRGPPCRPSPPRCGSPSLDEPAELADGDLGRSQVERPRDPHPVLRLLVVLGVLVRIGRAHQELAGGDQHELHADRVGDRLRWLVRHRRLRSAVWSGRSGPVGRGRCGAGRVDHLQPVGGRLDWTRATRKPRSLLRYAGADPVPARRPAALRDAVQLPPRITRAAACERTSGSAPGDCLVVIARRTRPSTTPRHFRACRRGRRHSAGTGPPAP